MQTVMILSLLVSPKRCVLHNSTILPFSFFYRTHTGETFKTILYTFMNILYEYIPKQNISSGTMLLPRVYYLFKNLRSCLVLGKKTRIKCIVHLLQQLQRGQSAEIQSLQHRSLKTLHFYKCTKTCITAYCLLVNENINLNLEIL